MANRGLPEGTTAAGAGSDAPTEQHPGGRRITRPRHVGLVVAAVAVVTLVVEPWATGDTPERAGQEVVPTPNPSRTAGEAPTSTQPRELGDFPGRPRPGSVLWGAAILNAGDPALHERPAMATMGIHRTYWQWDERASDLVDAARDDVDHGRVPWVSVKAPDWRSMAAGEHDEEIDELLRALRDLDGPVWLTVHHEPEGGGGLNAPDDPGGPAAHLEMNRRVRQRLDALDVQNVALAPILMAYTWEPESGRDPDEWWAPEVYDVLGVDIYLDEPGTLLTDVWYRIRGWAEAREVPLAIAEWGMRGDGQVGRDNVVALHQHALASSTDGRGAPVLAVSAFDSVGLKDWRLSGSQREAFRDLIGHVDSAMP